MLKPLGIIFHRELLESGKWGTMTAEAQLGNIWAEAGRAIHAKAIGDQEKLQGASIRMYELFDMAFADQRWRGKGVLSEMCRAREIVSDFLYGENQYGENANTLDQYFMAYGVMANTQRMRARGNRLK